MNKNVTETSLTPVVDELEKFIKIPYLYAYKLPFVGTKVGFSKNVDVRIPQWKRIYPDLEEIYRTPTVVDGGMYFVDHPVHKDLIKSGKHRVQRDEFPKGLHYSCEVFADTTAADVEKSVYNVKSDIANGTALHKCMYINNTEFVGKHYKRDEKLVYELRKMQKEIVVNFHNAIKNNKKMLCVAPTRAGKCLTAMQCGKEMESDGAKVIVILSGKVDVKDEWQRITERPKNYEGFYFLDSEDLNANPNAIANKKEEGNVVIFLSLQDLKGKDVKEKHKELLNTDVDLLIVDETHFAARAPEYGEILRNKDNVITQESDISDDSISKDIVSKYIHAKYWLHLTATPDPTIIDEFSAPDAEIIGYYTDKDLIDARDEWSFDNEQSDEPKSELDSPYAGLPDNMFITNNLFESMKDMDRSSGSFLNDLFETKSIDTSGDYTKFKRSKYVFNFLKMIDGSVSNPNVLPIFTNKSIKKNGLGRHNVWLFPNCSSCDAMEVLMQNNLDQFDNLKDYVIINLAGHNNKFKNVREFKEEIDRLDAEGKKTITLTVKRCLTGNTIPPWDTLLILSDRLSYKEYWQAIGRLKSSNIGTFKDDDGNIMKLIKKFQTLCIDFNPYRMLNMVEMKCQIQSTLKGKSGNDKVLEELESELKTTPILFYEGLKLTEATPTNVLEKIREYSRNSSIHDVVKSITDNVASSILNSIDIQDIIEKYKKSICKNGNNNKTNSVSLFEKDPSEPSGNPENSGNPEIKPKTNDTLADHTNSDQELENEDIQHVNINNEIDNKEEDVKIMSFRKFLENIIQFAILTNNKVNSLTDIINTISTNMDDRRIANNIYLDVNHLNVLYKELLDNKELHRQIDYAIFDANRILNDSESLSVKEKVTILQNKFEKISDNEIVTPNHTAEEMITLLENNVENIDNMKFLDIAAKQGEFAFAIYNKFAKNNPNVVNNIVSLPTSSPSYEFTRKVYELIGLPLENIIENYKSTDIISKSNEDIMKKITDMNIDVIVGNPAYNQKDGGAGSSSKPLYNLFIEQAKKINPHYMTMIIPSKWYAGGKGLDSFRENMLNDKHMKILHDFNDETECFTGVVIKGGVCYFLWDNEYNGDCEVNNHIGGKIVSSMKRPLLEDGLDTFVRQNEAISILKKVIGRNEKSFNTIISSRKPFGLPTNFTDFKEKEFKGSIKIYANQKDGFVDRNYITKNFNWIDRYKIYIPEAIGEGDMSKDQLNPIMSGYNTCCTETYLVVGPFESEIETQNAYKYMKTKFLHFMLGLKKVSHHTTYKVYQFVPLQNFTTNSDIDWNKSIDEIDQQLYAKYGLTTDEIAFIESKIRSMK